MKPYLVFDVESVGLHGEGYSVGWVVVDERGDELVYGKASTSIGDAVGTLGGHLWAEANAKPDFPLCHSAREVRKVFWDLWLFWKAQNATLVADCLWPVEARFLLQCVADHFPASEWQGPYPFIDVASVRLAVGLDPLATEGRLEDELPVHCPLADARQSARLFIEAMKLASLQQSSHKVLVTECLTHG